MSKIGTDIEHLQHVISEVLLNEWEAQGHSMSGKIVKEIEYQVKQETNKLILSGFMYPYGSIVAAGTPSSKIPFSGRTGRGGHSLYIEALQSYVKNRMNIQDEKKSLSVAFAIAHTQKNEGMPTKASYRFSSNGRRKDWVEGGLKNDKVTEAISELAHNVLSVNLDVIINKWQIELNKN